LKNGHVDKVNLNFDTIGKFRAAIIYVYTFAQFLDPETGPQASATNVVLVFVVVVIRFSKY